MARDRNHDGLIRRAVVKMIIGNTKETAVDKVQSLFKSRRFWVAVAGVVVVVTDGLGFPLSSDGVQNVVLLLASWIVGDSLNKTA